MKIRNIGSLLLVCTAFGSQAWAQGDIDDGKVKFYTCAGCHSIPGYSNSAPNYQVPKLGGQQPAYLISAIKDYASGARTHTSMEGNAYSRSEQDLQDLAAYISQHRRGNTSNNVTGDVASGKKIAENCASCHGKDGNSEGNFPKLAGQYESYLMKALHDYKSGARKNPIMSGAVSNLSDADIHNLAAYYASQRRGLTIVSD